MYDIRKQFCSYRCVCVCKFEMCITMWLSLYLCVCVCVCVCVRVCVFQVWSELEDENLPHRALSAMLSEGEAAVRKAALTLVQELFLASKFRYNTTQHNTTQHNTIQHNTTQHSTRHSPSLCPQQPTLTTTTTTTILTTVPPLQPLLTATQLPSIASIESTLP